LQRLVLSVYSDEQEIEQTKSAAFVRRHAWRDDRSSIWSLLGDPVRAGGRLAGGADFPRKIAAMGGARVKPNELLP
jgi:hypothetical protein